MGKIISKYENDLDKCWYDSSNVLYSECNDKDNALKEVKVVFKNGATYLYKEVKVQDYLMFRDSSSNGKAFFKYIKNHDFEKLDNSNVDDLKEELHQLLIEISEQEKENIEENGN